MNRVGLNTLILVLCLSAFAPNATGQDAAELAAPSAPVNDVGQYLPFLQSYADEAPRSLSYLARDWQDREQWRIRGRAKMHELLCYDPPAAALNPEVLESVDKQGYTRHRVRYSVAADRRTEAFLLIPDDVSQPAPAVVALHDHGGFYYFGKEKVTETENPPGILRDFIDRSYGGRTFADELARRGFVVLVPDAFYFGSQRLDLAQVSGRFTEDLVEADRDSDEFIRQFNGFSRDHETLVAKSIFTAGSTWPGILFQGDRAGVDYLLSRPEVDPERVGCMGLSIGGFRSAHLAGLDPRIKVAVVAGWMTTYDTLIQDHLRNHTWMVYVPGQHRHLDLPDVASLNAPRPLMVVNCLQDQLFTIEGMRSAERTLAAVYEKMTASDRFLCRYYDVPHSLNVAMQDDAIEWIEHWLK